MDTVITSLPLIGRGLLITLQVASLALLTFVNTWNDYMGPFIYLTSNRLWTVQLGLRLPRKAANL